MRVAWRIGIGVLLAIGYGFLPAPDPLELALQSAAGPLGELAARVSARGEAARETPIGVGVEPPDASARVLRGLRKSLKALGSAVRLEPAEPVAASLGVRIQWDEDLVHVEAHDREGSLVASPSEFGETGLRFSAPLRRRHSLLPPLLAIALALLTHRTLLSLGAGALLGSILIVWDGAVSAAAPGAITMTRVISIPFEGLAAFLREYVWQTSLTDSFHVEILLFVVALMGLVGLLGRAGGLQGLVNLLVRFARGRRSTKVLTWLMGIFVFFDDYANSILVGGTMRPLTDRWKVSREKLAYLIDSTAAPVAGIAVLSTWVAYEISQFAGPALDLGLTETMGAAYTLFLRTLPYRFYCFFTLWFVLASSLLHRDFGSMLRAERRAALRGEVLAPGAKPLVSEALTRIGAKPGVRPLARNALLPLGWVLGFIAAGIWVVGTAPEGTAARILAAGPVGAVTACARVLVQSFWDLASTVAGSSDGPGFVARLRDAFERSGDFNSRILALAAWTGVAGALLGFVATRTLALREALAAAFAGARSMMLALVILLLAWALGAICKDLGTARYLLALTHHFLTPTFFTVTLFLLSCVTAFATGTSWGTMALLLPNVLYLAYRVGESSPLGSEVFTVVAIGAVLEGAIFGDHCSPISDTTILSSTAAASDHVDHVRTQIPYAMVTMIAALLVGYIPVAQGVSPWLCFLAGVALLTAFLLIFGRSPEAPAAGEQRGA